MFPDDLERVNTNFSQMVKGIHTGPHEYRSIRKDGSIFDIEVKGGVIRNNNGEISRLVFIARDVTERKQIQNKIKQSEVEFRTVWENSANGLRLTDKDGNIVRVNEAFCQIFGKTKKNWRKKLLLTFILRKMLPKTFRNTKNASLKEKWINISKRNWNCGTVKKNGFGLITHF
jgi:PAS domain-containing protein